MIGLLIEYVADERSASRSDPARTTFLANLATELTTLVDRVRPSSEDFITRLRAIAEACDPDFAEDEVMAHVHACIEELERIARHLRG